MRQYEDSISSAINGLPVYQAQVFLQDAGGTPVQVYSDEGVTPLAQPVLTDGLGFFSFFVPDGTYTLVVADPDGSNPRSFPKTEIYEDARNVSVPVSEAGVTLPSIGARAGRLLGFDGAGLPIGVAADAEDLATIASIAPDIETVADISGAVTTVAGIAANVTAVAGIASSVVTTAANIGAITTCATNISAIIAAPAAATSAAASAAIAASYATRTFTTLALASAITVGQRAIVPQTLGYAEDNYLQTASGMSLIQTNPVGPGILATQRIAMLGSPPVTQHAVTPYFEMDPVDGKFVDGRLVPSKQQPTTTHNLFPGVDGITSGSGTLVFTPNYVVDAGVGLLRIQLPTSGNYARLGANLPAGTYRFIVRLRSTTGAGAQTVKMGLYNSGPLTALTSYNLVEGSDTVCDSGLVTVAAGAQFLMVAQANAADILLRPLPCQLYADTEVIPATEPSRRFVLRAIKNAVRPTIGTIPFGPGNSVLGPISSQSDFSDDTGTSPTFSAMTFVTAFYEETASDNNGSAFVTSNAADFAQLGAGTTAGPSNPRLSIRAPGMAYPSVGVAAQYVGGTAITGRGWVIVAGRFNSTITTLHIDGGYAVGYGNITGPGHATMTVPGLWLGGYFSGANNDHFKGGFIPPTIFGSYLSDTDLVTEMQRMRDRITTFGDTYQKRAIWIAEGDSITQGYIVPTLAYPGLIANATGMGPWGMNYAVTGSTLASLVAGREAYLLQSIKGIIAMGHHRPVYSLPIGTNGIPTMADLRTHWAKVRAAGAVVVACTIPARASWTVANGLETARLAYNAAIRADLGINYDYLIDFGGDSIMGDPAQALAGVSGVPIGAGPLYFHTDGIHPVQAGQDRMATIAQPVIVQALAYAGTL